MSLPPKMIRESHIMVQRSYGWSSLCMCVRETVTKNKVQHSDKKHFFILLGFTAYHRDTQKCLWEIYAFAPIFLISVIEI